ncbi:MAG TPA: cadmium-translocating P-type ATPase [Persephonella sp.]|uniref:Copper-translocating P-type ATPase n=1 Tax=Persephonella marina (strain DSM 14350 / EX-H1) TaxID=123214 RepID=C0QRK0_PERMH|nr:MULTISPECIES: heavy metal translocating P-type ATPase [Persephonella]ACO04451.1 copper-translocating P-type ATPase [Persephonella marina EX-H1]HCB69041.1 cadmium-translocating P-type ATPase [Persephonella sp.]
MHEKHEDHHKHTGHVHKHEKHHEHPHKPEEHHHKPSEDHKGHDHAAHIEEFKKRFIVSVILTVPVLLLSEMIQRWFGFSITIPFQKWVLLLLSSVIYFYGGYPFLKGLISEIKNRQPGMMTLIGTAISVAFFYSAFTVFVGFGKEFFWELATLIDVMLLGHYIEAKSVLGASRALEELVKIMPTTAHLIKGEEIVDVKVSDLKKGDVVLVKPGEKIPSDGIVIEGESYVNEALLTGESKPVLKKRGSKVIGGSINQEGVLRVKIEKTGEETYLSQVIKLVKQAQESKSRTQDLANKTAAALFYIAMAVGIITYTVWFFIETPDFALERAVTVLVIACPHALGLAVPLVVAISTSMTAKNGILIRDRRAFEQAKDLNAVIFDKTGTLTEGKFGVTDIVSFIDEDELLQLSMSIERNSEHIIAKAITNYAKEKGIKPLDVKDYKTIPGKGAFGVVDGKQVYVGSPNLLKEFGIEIEDERIKRLQEEGKTVVFVVIDGQLSGAFALSDRIKPESYEAVKQLKEMGVKVFMLTGDAEEVARSVSQELGIDDYFAQVLPHEKAQKVELLKNQGYKVGMVGDGINDAPALVTADVGIAIGAGTDVAIESADVILVKSNPADVPKVIKISRMTFSKMVQNLWWAAGYNIVAIPLAAGVLYNYGIVIQPAVGAILMSISTVIVSLNSQTLKLSKV